MPPCVAWYQTHHKQCDHHLDIPHILFDYHDQMKGPGSAKNFNKLKAKVQKYVEKFGFFTQKGSDVTRYVYRKLHGQLFRLFHTRMPVILGFVSSCFMSLAYLEVGVKG